MIFEIEKIDQKGRPTGEIEKVELDEIIISVKAFDELVKSLRPVSRATLYNYGAEIRLGGLSIKSNHPSNVTFKGRGGRVL